MHSDGVADRVVERGQDSNRGADQEADRDREKGRDTDCPMTWDSLGVYDDEDLNEVMMMSALE